jgi:hypothetical protein
VFRSECSCLVVSACVGVRTSRPSLRLAVPVLPRFACSQLEKEYDKLNTHAKQLTSTVQTVLASESSPLLLLVHFCDCFRQVACLAHLTLCAVPHASARCATACALVPSP